MRYHKHISIIFLLCCFLLFAANNYENNLYSQIAPISVLKDSISVRDTTSSAKMQKEIRLTNNRGEDITSVIKKCFINDVEVPMDSIKKIDFENITKLLTLQGKDTVLLYIYTK